MPRSAVVVDPEYLKHDPGRFHPERPQRIRVLLDLAAELDSHFIRLEPRAATQGELESCHTRDYIEVVRATSKKNSHALDGDTITSRDSFGVGLLATGGFLRLLDAIAATASRSSARRATTRCPTARWAFVSSTRWRSARSTFAAATERSAS
jgi:acetoin utilization deacetylase AcuC-like enzyme